MSVFDCKTRPFKQNHPIETPARVRGPLSHISESGSESEFSTFAPELGSKSEN